MMLTPKPRPQQMLQQEIARWLLTQLRSQMSWVQISAREEMVLRAKKIWLTIVRAASNKTMS